MNQETLEASEEAQSQKGWKNAVKELVILLVLFLILRGSVVQAFVIPSGSMEPTLQIGDHLLVNKLSYGLRLFGFSETIYQYDKPKRGDIVVFTLADDKTTSPDIYLIKRVVGLEGETVEVRNAQVLINGEVIKENSNVNWQLGGIKDFGPLNIPENSIFVMGDNRDHSRDARFWSNPFLNLKRVEGRAFIMYWPRFGLI